MTLTGKSEVYTQGSVVPSDDPDWLNGAAARRLKRRIALHTQPRRGRSKCRQCQAQCLDGECPNGCEAVMP